MKTSEIQSRPIRLEESARVPRLALVLGTLAVVPFVAGVLAIWLLPPGFAFLAANFTIVWGTALILFYSGVARGVSFRTPGGATGAQVATALWLFAAGFLALLGIVWGYRSISLGLLIAGFATLAVLDPIAARKGEAPLFFARLRPVQMVVPIVSLAIVLAVLLSGGIL